MSENFQNVPPMPNEAPAQPVPPVENVAPAQPVPPVENVAPAQPQKKNDMPMITMICGIASIVLAIIGCFCCVGYLCIPAGIAAIILGLKCKKENNDVWDNQAKIGFICGIVGLVLMVVVFIVAFIAGLGLAAAGASSYSYY